MNEDSIQIARIIYGDDASILFNGKYIIGYTEENKVKLGTIYKDNGDLLIGAKVRGAVPILDNNSKTIAYLIIDETTYNKIYNSFYKRNSKGRWVTITDKPIYTKVAILTEKGKIETARSLITPYRTLYPLMDIVYKSNKFICNFEVQTGKLLEFKQSGGLTIE